MFSKFAKIPTTNIITWNDYYNKNINLNSFKLPEIKEIICTYGLKRTGTKKTHIANIISLFNKNLCASRIQRVTRGYFVRLCMILHGPAIKDCSLCVNQTDFYTLEPLDELDKEFIYSYRDDKGFIYGFNVNSLVTMIRNQGKTIHNPYNRELMDIQKVRDIINLFKLIAIVYPTNYLNMKDDAIQTNVMNPIYNIFPSAAYQPRTTILSHITNIRNKPFDNRLQDVFIEIDLLGNYTQSWWFSRLEKIDYFRFYQYIHYIWYISGTLSYQIKREICPFFDPFAHLLQNTYHPSLIDSTTAESREYCLSIIENFVYGGIDIEYRKIGILHILSALTMVSLPAREHMEWLYESLVAIIPQ